MSKVENPPAFPFAPTDRSNETHLSAGMTLRDWFAGQAIPAASVNTGRDQWDQVARRAYAIADALLAQREEKS